MIVNQKHENSIIEMMEKSQFSFYLTGSRFFGDYNRSSDWDFFVKESKEVRNWLLMNGFFCLSRSRAGYDDTTIVSIYQSQDLNGLIVQVQLVLDVAIKDYAQNLLKQFGNMEFVPKESRKFLWYFSIAIASQNMAIKEMNA